MRVVYSYLLQGEAGRGRRGKASKQEATHLGFGREVGRSPESPGLISSGQANEVVLTSQNPRLTVTILEVKISHRTQSGPH